MWNQTLHIVLYYSINIPIFHIYYITVYYCQINIFQNVWIHFYIIIWHIVWCWYFFCCDKCFSFLTYFQANARSVKKKYSACYKVGINDSKIVNGVLWIIIQIHVNYSHCYSNSRSTSCRSRSIQLNFTFIYWKQTNSKNPDFFWSSTLEERTYFSKCVRLCMCKNVNQSCPESIWCKI